MLSEHQLGPTTRITTHFQGSDSLNDNKIASALGTSRAAAGSPSQWRLVLHVDLDEHVLAGCRALVALMSAGDAESAAVLTPYNGQVRLIRSILKSKGGSLYDKVRTTPRSTTARAQSWLLKSDLQAAEHACAQLFMSAPQCTAWKQTHVTGISFCSRCVH